MVPLPKSKDKTNPANYRQVLLLSVLSRVPEKHVHSHLYDYSEKCQLLHPFGMGLDINATLHWLTLHILG